MISSADSVLSEGLALMRSFVETVQKTPELLRGGILVAFQPQIDAWTDRADDYLEANPGIPLATQSKLRSAIVMGDDIADQSPKHVNSLVARVTSFLGSGAGPSPASPQPGNVSTKPQPASAGSNMGLIVIAVIVLLALKG